MKKKKRCSYCGSAKHTLKQCPLNPPKDVLECLTRTQAS